MTTLPSFVELMASLGIDPEARKPDQDNTSSSRSSPSSSPRLLTMPASSPSRSKSSPSLRDQASRPRSARYSPYSSTFMGGSKRRGSVSSMSSSSSDMSERASSSSPSLSPRIRKRTNNNLTVNMFGSSTDLAANTPISSYVRRKTPGTSPTSPSHPLQHPEESSRASPMPFTLPTLPSFLPRSASSESFPITSNSDLDSSSSEQSSPSYILKPLPNSHLEFDIMSRRSRFHTGIRISTQPRPADVSGKYPGHRVVHVA